jgi:hypothetical protein
MTGLVVGCLWSAIGSAVAAPPTTPPTFTKDVAPIFYKNCVICHRPGEIAPMSLLTYDNVRPWAKAIRQKVSTRQMPPWFADPQYGKFMNDRRLKQEEIDTIVAWVDAGMPRGADKDAPPAPQFASGWLHPKGLAPDYIVEMPFDFQLPAEGEIPMTNFYTAMPFQEDKFAEAIQVKPGNRAVVHHGVAQTRELPAGTKVENGILVDAKTGQPIDNERQFREPGTQESAEARLARAEAAQVGSRDIEWLAVYAPGWDIETYRPGAARRIVAGRYMNFNMHYQANGRPEKDRSSVGIWLQKVPVTSELRTLRIGETHIVEGKELVAKTSSDVAEAGNRRGSRALLPNIPPYAENWAITGVTPVAEDITIHAFIPHMHLRGHDMKYVAVFPDGREETLLSVPKYDFNWQLFYVPEAPLRIPAGSKIMTVGHYDNSLKNKYNPAPGKEVFWSEQSWDEMYNGFIVFARDRQPNERQATQSGQPQPR